MGIQSSQKAYFFCGEKTTPVQKGEEEARKWLTTENGERFLELSIIK